MTQGIHTLVIGEPDFDTQKGIRLKDSTLSALQAAHSLHPAHTTLLLISHLPLPAQIPSVDHVDTVVVVTHPDPASLRLVENLAPSIAHYVRGIQATENPITHILSPANAFGKNMLPRLSALLDVSMLSDVISIIDSDTFVRPIYAGNVWVTLSNKDPLKIMSIRPTAFTPTHSPSSHHTTNQQPAALTITHWPVSQTVSSIRWVQQTVASTDHPELTSADIVIAGGRGLKSAEAFDQLKAIAHLLGAALGASRAAVEAGFAPNHFQVGQTGKVVAPKIYIAVGISGAIQHVAGMSESKLIIVINSDPEAPIFDIADYGLVGDLFEILPLLEKRLREKKIL